MNLKLEAVSAIEQYEEIIASKKCSALFGEFDEHEDRLDEMYLEIINTHEHSELLAIVFKVLLLAHGTASIESGFSINKAMIDDNQHLDTLIVLKKTQDGLKACGGALKFQVTKDVLLKGARTKYKNDLKHRKKDRTLSVKRNVEEQIHMVSALTRRI